MRSRIPASKNAYKWRFDFCVLKVLRAHDYVISQICARLLDFRKMGE